MRLSLRGGEKLYINGAVLSVDRRVSIELLNDVTFLLETHIMQASDASTPLRQLYFIVQLLLMEPAAAPETRSTFDAMLRAEQRAFSDPVILAGLRSVEECVAVGRPFEAMRALRSLFSRESDIIGARKPVAA